MAPTPEENTFRPENKTEYFEQYPILKPGLINLIKKVNYLLNIYVVSLMKFSLTRT